MFWSNLFNVAKLVAILYLMVIVGFAADKIGKFTHKAAKLATGLLFYIVTPCVIVNSFIVNFSGKVAVGMKDFGLAMLFFAVTYAIAIPISKLFFKKQPLEKRVIYRHAVVYGNCGYIGLPLVQAVVGERGVFFTALAITVFNILTFTQGVYQMHEGENGKANIRLSKVLINPGTLGLIFGAPLLVLMLVFHLDLTTPAWEILTKPIAYIGSMNTPLAMLCLGTFLAHTDISNTFKDKNNYLVAFLRLIVIPLALFAVILAVNRFVCAVPAVVAVSLMVSACPPSANNTVLFAANFDKDVGLASTTVASGTFLSVLTMPVILAFVQQVFPL